MLLRFQLSDDIAALPDLDTGPAPASDALTTSRFPVNLTADAALLSHMSTLPPVPPLPVIAGVIDLPWVGRQTLWRLAVAWHDPDRLFHFITEIELQLPDRHAWAVVCIMRCVSISRMIVHTPDQRFLTAALVQLRVEHAVVDWHLQYQQACNTDVCSSTDGIMHLDTPTTQGVVCALDRACEASGTRIGKHQKKNSQDCAAYKALAQVAAAYQHWTTFWYGASLTDPLD
jgi:hypothetical protein